MQVYLNNQQWLICHKTKPNQTKPNESVWEKKANFTRIFWVMYVRSFNLLRLKKLAHRKFSKYFFLFLITFKLID